MSRYAIRAMMKRKDVKEKTLVWWNISRCPVPDGFDPRLVRPRIESALNNSGYGNGGPLTITAIGNLTQVPGDDDVLRKLSSTGIALKHAHDIQIGLYWWTSMNPSPAKIMLICGPEELKQLAPVLKREGYSILVAHPQRPSGFSGDVCKEWLWKSLLSGDTEGTKRLVLQDKYSETGESPWYCSVCSFAGKSFEHFSTHLKSEKHAYFDWDFWASRNNVDRTNPANLVHGRSKASFIISDFYFLEFKTQLSYLSLSLVSLMCIWLSSRSGTCSIDKIWRCVSVLGP